MNDLLAEFLHRTRFTMEMLLACALFFAALGKRRNFWPRVLAGIAAALVGSVLLSMVDNMLFLGGFLLSGLFVLLCCKVTVPDAVYCAACAYATQHVAWLVYELFERTWGKGAPDPAAMNLSYFLLYPAVYALSYFLFARNLADGEHYHLDTRRSLFSAVLILAVVWFLSIAATAAYTSEVGTWLYIICQCYAMFCCAFFLWVQVSQVRQAQLQAKLIFQQQFSRQQREQYELTRETIDLINQKCHDLKHQVSALRTVVPEEQREAHLREIEHAVQIYDSTLKTGSDVLDTVLTEKSLYCESHQISMTCIADGDRLSFLDAVDVYTIFGNALDNAIEGVDQLPDPDQRVITVTVKAKSGLLVIQLENCYAQGLTFKDGIPLTTKEQKDYHGFGLRSIQYTVEKYGGHMTIHTEGNLFALRITIPIP